MAEGLSAAECGSAVHGGDAGGGPAADIVRRTAARHGSEAAPVLALATFERTGSNWLSDSLRAGMPQHNEPFRQQLGRAHPLSPGNRIAVALEDAVLGALGAHHLECALDDLYGQPRHLVKETNLFFATDTVLRLLPRSPVLVLTRAPLGIASSFARGRLWARWKYADRYAQVAATARSPRWREQFAPLLPQDDPEEPVALGRLIAVNALLLARSLAASGRYFHVVPYEQHVTDRAAVLDGLARHLRTVLPHAAPAAPAAPAAADATFATSGHKDGLVADLAPRTAELVTAHAASTVSLAGELLEARVTATAADWLAGGDLYEVREPAARRPARAATAALVPASAVPVTAYRPVTRVSWRNTLVTNAEMADLLTLLHAAGAPNTRLGTHLLVCPMPHERGGRLHFDATRRRWWVSSGYETHPAYWVTWVGAAVMATWSGARLPTRTEALEAAADARAYNADYAVGDTCPVAEPGRGPGQIHHMVGNLQNWCGDGPDVSDPGQPRQRYLVGAAWNTPGTPEAIRAPRSRYLLGSSRGVGIRLVRDSRTTVSSGLGAWELAHLLNGWIDALRTGPDRSPGDVDRVLVTALTGDERS
ncbi:hypothetical protein [Streptomyces sp. NPDC059142]|uniref:hypothetical protein n=1 Tax=Streptomyces sp. NPDC059142 TaxID=3346739 RepID=UPI00368C1B04